MTQLLNNRYRILRLLGTGGFGKTFLAEDTHMPSGRYCAVKHLTPPVQEPATRLLIQQRFAREAAILEDLGEGCDQIPTLYAYFCEAGHCYLVQELIEGITLKQIVRERGSFEEATLQPILVSLLHILDYIHSKGVIHRDIKPDNIILRGSDGKPVLIDFGIAKESMWSLEIEQGVAIPSIAAGTPGFMPPEQAAGKPVYATDLYSLGLTAIVLLTGKLPQELPINPRTGHFYWRDAVITCISDNLANVLETAIQPWAVDRYPSAQAMLNALTGELSEADTLPPPSALQPYYLERFQAPVLTPNFPNPPHFGPTRTHSSLRNRQILLNKVRNYWIRGVLEHSLYQSIRIELGFEERPDAVEHPWQMVWQTSEQSRETVPSGVRAIDKFDELGMGRTLLILGDPGSGKTTTLLELTRDLLNRAETDNNQPIPVVFNLSSWAIQPSGFLRHPHSSLDQWLVQELKNKYQVSSEISWNWIKEQHLLLMLDGLDEVQAEFRNSCVQAINHFVQQYGQTEVVLCSRLKDYEALSIQLRMQAAICLRPLTLNQIEQYLAWAGQELDAVRVTLQTDEVLQELARSPLMLSIIALAYWGKSFAGSTTQSLEEQRNTLFKTYVERMLQRRGIQSPYPPPQTLRWLKELARHLIEESQSIFLLERIQPTWLGSPTEKLRYALIVGSLGGLAIGITGGLHVGLLYSPSIGVLSSGILGIAGTVVTSSLILFLQHIEPVETLRWSWAKARANLLIGIGFGLLIGLVFYVGSGLITLHFFGHFRQVNEFFKYLVRGLGLGMIVILLRGLTGPGIEINTCSNQGIWQSGKNAIVFSSVGALGLGALAKGLGMSSLYGMAIGLMLGLFSPAGLACVQHFSLRFLLWQQKVIPWNYTQFLDYASQLIILQKVGGGYIFVHRLLLEYFASLDL